MPIGKAELQRRRRRLRTRSALAQAALGKEAPQTGTRLTQAALEQLAAEHDTEFSELHEEALRTHERAQKALQSFRTAEQSLILRIEVDSKFGYVDPDTVSEAPSVHSVAAEVKEGEEEDEEGEEVGSTLPAIERKALEQEAEGEEAEAAAAGDLELDESARKGRDWFAFARNCCGFGRPKHPPPAPKKKGAAAATPEVEEEKKEEKEEESEEESESESESEPELDPNSKEGKKRKKEKEKRRKAREKRKKEKEKRKPKDYSAAELAVARVMPVMTGYVRAEALKRAKKRGRSQLVHMYWDPAGKTTEKFPLDTPLEELSRFGVGMSLYFRFLRWLALWSIPLMGALAYNVYENYLEDNLPSGSSWFVRMSILSSDPSDQTLQRWFHALFTLLCCLLLMFVQFKVDAIGDKVNADNVTPADYTVELVGLPTDRATMAEDIAQHMRGWGEVVHVANVFGVTTLISKTRAHSVLRRKIEIAARRIALRRLDPKTAENEKAKAKGIPNLQKLCDKMVESEKELRDLNLQRAFDHTKTGKERKMDHGYRNSGRVFVMFNDSEAARHCLVDNRRQSLLRRRPKASEKYECTACHGKHVHHCRFRPGGGCCRPDRGQKQCWCANISVERPNEPADVVWANVPYRRPVQIARAAVTWTLTILLLVADLALMWTAHQMRVQITTDCAAGGSGSPYGSASLCTTMMQTLVSLIPSVAIVAFNGILLLLFGVMLDFERHHSQSDRTAFLISRLVFAQFVNSALLTLILYNNSNTWTDSGDLIDQVGSTILINAIVPPFVEFLKYKMRLWVNGFRTRFEQLEMELNRFQEPPSFDIADRFAFALRSFAVCLFFFALIPLGLLLATLTLLTALYVDKIRLLRLSKCPIQYDEAMAVQSVRLLGQIVGLSVCVSIYFSSVVGQQPLHNLDFSILSEVPVLVQIGIYLLYLFFPFRALVEYISPDDQGITGAEGKLFMDQRDLSHYAVPTPSSMFKHQALSKLGLPNLGVSAAVLMDTNGDGVLDRVEFKEAMDRLGIELTDSEVEKLMSAFDSDGDGTLRTQEFAAAAAQFDRNGDGNVDYDEFIAYCLRHVRGGKGRMPMRSGQGGRSQGREKAFADFDTNSDGMMSARELRLKLEAEGVPVTPADVQLIMRLFDADGDGVVSEEEFEAVIGDFERRDGSIDFSHFVQCAVELAKGGYTAHRARAHAQFGEFFPVMPEVRVMEQRPSGSAYFEFAEEGQEGEMAQLEERLSQKWRLMFPSFAETEEESGVAALFVATKKQEALELAADLPPEDPVRQLIERNAREKRARLEAEADKRERVQAEKEKRLLTALAPSPTPLPANHLREEEDDFATATLTEAGKRAKQLRQQRRRQQEAAAQQRELRAQREAAAATKHAQEIAAARAAEEIQRDVAQALDDVHRQQHERVLELQQLRHEHDPSLLLLSDKENHLPTVDLPPPPPSPPQVEPERRPRRARVAQVEVLGEEEDYGLCFLLTVNCARRLPIGREEEEIQDLYASLHLPGQAELRVPVCPDRCSRACTRSGTHDRVLVYIPREVQQMADAVKRGMGELRQMEQALGRELEPLTTRDREELADKAAQVEERRAEVALVEAAAETTFERYLMRIELWNWSAGKNQFIGMSALDLSTIQSSGAKPCDAEPHSALRTLAKHSTMLRLQLHTTVDQPLLSPRGLPAELAVKLSVCKGPPPPSAPPPTEPEDSVSAQADLTPLLPPPLSREQLAALEPTKTYALTLHVGVSSRKKIRLKKLPKGRYVAVSSAPAVLAVSRDQLSSDGSGEVLQLRFEAVTEPLSLTAVVAVFDMLGEAVEALRFEVSFVPLPVGDDSLV